MANFAIERGLRNSNFQIIIGLDEAGRGPLAGPVVAAAIWLRTTHFKNRIDDSKKLTPHERENAFFEIIHKSVFALGLVDERMIDALNILNATRVCMREAVNTLLEKISAYIHNRRICILVDGNIKLGISDYPVFNIIKGDEKSKTIASASILAKVSRDQIMSLYDKVWPQYGFLRHKGYPTSFHRLALRQFGPCPIHRLSFAYV